MFCLYNNEIRHEKERRSGRNDKKDRNIKWKE